MSVISLSRAIALVTTCCLLGIAMAAEDPISRIALARTLRFPTDRVAGWISIRPEGTGDASAWQLHHEAWGEISIPPGHEVSLKMESLDRAAPYLLQWIEADDLTQLEVACLEFGVAQGSLAASFSGLKQFKLATRRIDPGALDELAGITTLERLDIRETPAKAADFASLSLLKNLREVVLPSSTSDVAAEDLGRVTSLQKLDLSHMENFGDAGLAQLAGLTKLRAFNLPPLASDRGLECLSEMRKLKQLSLVMTSITDKALGHLKNLDALESLDLSVTRIQGTGLSQLAELANLRTLRLYGSQVKDPALARLDDLPALQSLDLSHTPITDDGVVHLGDLKHLKRLDLSYTPITARGLVSLSQISSLEELVLVGTNITDDGLAHLTTMKSLRLLRLPIQMSLGAVEQLQKAIPQCLVPNEGPFNPAPATTTVGADQPVA